MRKVILGHSQKSSAAGINVLKVPFYHVLYIITQFNVFQVTDTPGDDVERRLSSSVDRHVDSIAKYNYALHRILAGRFNFTYVLT
jgi:hypothetical protein